MPQNGKWVSRMKCKYEGEGRYEGRCYGTKEIDPCPGYDKCSNFKANFTTIADHIRSMNDEELAEFLNRVKQPCNYCQLAVVMGACTESLCDDAMEKWLKQPYEEQNTNSRTVGGIK